jgi:hypothetical protein
MDLTTCDVDTKWGKQALRRVYAAVFWRQAFGPFKDRHSANLAAAVTVAAGTAATAADTPPVAPDHPPNQRAEFRAAQAGQFVHWFTQAPLLEQQLKGVGLTMADTEKGNVKKFLNRLLGLQVAHQNLLFDFFQASLAYIVETAQREGKFDSGVADIRAESMLLQRQDIFMENAATALRCMHHVVELDRGTFVCTL